MKKLLLVLIIPLFYLSCNKKSGEENVNSDWTKFNLNGKVKSFREIKFLAVDNFSIISSGEKIKHIYNQEVLFNLDGNKIEQNDYIPDGTLANRTVYLYQKDKLVEFNEYDSQGILFGTGKYKFNDEGQITRLNFITNDGRYNWIEAYQYDAKGNVTEVKRFKTEEVIDTKEIYAFDENNRIFESEFYRDNKLVSKNKYKYNNSNNYNELNFGDASTYSFEYDYDAHGNWIKKIIFENKNPSGILIRDIEYFD